MTKGIYIKSIEFNDSTKVTLEPNDIIVFVGPNNVGKSHSLKELNLKLASLSSPTIIFNKVQLKTFGSSEEITNYVRSFSKSSFDADGMERFQGIGYNFTKQALDVYWPRTEDEGINNSVHPVFVELLTTEDRLKASNPPKNINLLNQPPNHPIHYLQVNDSIELEFEKYFKKAFDSDFIVNRNAGDTVPIHVGERPSIEKGEDRLSHSYLQKLNQLPLLHEQGDGMRSFIGVLLRAILANSSVLFIDEPEAFLHPPQAKLLGSMLGKNKPENRQLFLATHSIDLLKGLLDSGHKNLKVIRLDRIGNINTARVLDKFDIESIWGDSLLRHSNILDGLFHHKVVICESDSDCRFYSAILDGLLDNEDDLSKDVLFIHCGGKHRIPTVVKALHKLNVDVSIVVDFDILNDTNPIQPLIESLGANWNTIKKDFKIVKESIDQQRPELETNDVKFEIDKILTSTQDQIFPKTKAKEISKVLKKISAWSKAKQVGKSFIPNGEQSNAYLRLSSALENLNIYVVEVGELEGFDKTVGNHGPAWVNEVLSKDLFNATELEEARKFVKKFIK